MYYILFILDRRRGQGRKQTIFYHRKEENDRKGKKEYIAVFNRLVMC